MTLLDKSMIALFFALAAYLAYANAPKRTGDIVSCRIAGYSIESCQRYAL